MEGLGQNQEGSRPEMTCLSNMAPLNSALAVGALMGALKPMTSIEAVG